MLTSASNTMDHGVPLVYLFISILLSLLQLWIESPTRRWWTLQEVGKKEISTTWAWNHPFCSCKLMWMIQACLQWSATSQAFQWQGGPNSNGTGGFFHGHVHGNGWQIPNRTKHNKRNKDDQNQWSYHPGISTTSSALKKHASLCSRLDRHLNLWERDSCSPGKWNMAVSLQNRMSMADSRYL